MLRILDMLFCSVQSV